MSWKQWIVLIVLVVFVFPIIGMVVKSQNRQGSNGRNTPLPVSSQMLPLVSELSAPMTLGECYQQQTSQSMVGNVQIWAEFCQKAFDSTKHPIARSRALCQLMAWRKNIGNEEAQQNCDATNPLSSCPATMIFDLDNMRCEAKCDGTNGYAPDPTGRFCYLACPDGYPIYTETVLGCMQKSSP